MLFYNKNKDEIIKYFVLLSLLVNVSWQVLSAQLLHIDGAGRFPNALILTSLALILFTNRRASLNVFKIPIIIWSIWVLYNLCNLWYQGAYFVIFNTSKNPLYDVINALLNRWIFFMVLLWSLREQFHKTLWVITCACFISCIIYYSNANMLQHGNGEFESLRMLSEDIGGNEISIVAIVACFIALYLIKEKKNHFIIKVLLYSVFVFESWLIIKIASRTAFTILLLMIGFEIFYRLKNRVNICLCIIVFSIIFTLIPARQIIINTEVGRRLFVNAEKESLNVERQEYKLWWIDKYLGERAIYIHKGGDIWLKHPFFGVGYKNYIYYSGNYVCHIEYMAELAEGGIVGFLIFMSLFYYLFTQIRRCYFSNSYEKINFQMSVMGFAAFIMFNAGLFTTNQYPFYILYAVSLACVLEKDGYYEKPKINCENSCFME